MKITLVTNHDWTVEVVTRLIDAMQPSEELAMYIDGDVVTFAICSLNTAPNQSDYGKLIEVWYK